MTVGWKFGLGRFFPLSLLQAEWSAKQDEEDFLAYVRALLALGFFLAINFDPAYPSLDVLLSFYLTHSLLALKLARYRRGWKPWKLHLVDILWVGCIPVFVQGPNKPFYLFYAFSLFVLLAAAHRWGLYETLVTSAACIALLFVAVMLTGSGRWQILHSPPAEADFKGFAWRAASLLMTAYVVGYLGERGRGLRLKSSVIARLTQAVHSETSVRETLEVALGGILGIFNASRAALALREERKGRVFLWKADLTPGTQRSTVRWEELETFWHQRYFFPLPGTSCYAVFRQRPKRSKQPFQIFALSANGERQRGVSYAFPDDFLGSNSFTSLLVVSFAFGDHKEWSGRLFVFDPRINGAPEAQVRFLQALVGDVGPTVYAVYRLRRLRSRAGGMERARVARELHDGVIQSLIAIEMQIQVLRRRAACDRATADELERLQRCLRQEILNVRELAQQMKSHDLSSRTLVESMGEMIDKFRRDTGISVEFKSEQKHLEPPPSLAREVLQILGEALTNVRKHSGARKALVRFASKEGLWNLVVEDDGRGFDFSGRLSQAELDAGRRGPAVIRDRVRSIGGEITVQSAPGHGARLEITVAQNPK